MDEWKHDEWHLGGEPNPTLVAWYMEIAAIGMAYMVHSHRSVEQDGEF
jgi:hypothetical protein